MAGGRHRIMVHAGIRLRAQEKIATAGAHCTGEADRYGGEGASRAGARARCPSPLLHALGRDLVQHWEHLAELLHLPLMLLCRRRRLLVLAPRERHYDPHRRPQTSPRPSLPVATGASSWRKFVDTLNQPPVLSYNPTKGTQAAGEEGIRRVMRVVRSAA